MFDANLRGLPKGTVFFASVNSTCGNMDVSVDDILICKILDCRTENPEILVRRRNGECYKLPHCDMFEDFYLVYEGRLDGKGFLNDKRRENSFNELKHHLFT